MDVRALGTRVSRCNSSGIFQHGSYVESVGAHERRATSMDRERYLQSGGANAKISPRSLWMTLTRERGPHGPLAVAHLRRKDRVLCGWPFDVRCPRRPDGGSGGAPLAGALACAMCGAGATSGKLGLPLVVLRARLGLSERDCLDTINPVYFNMVIMWKVWARTSVPLPWTEKVQSGGANAKRSRTGPCGGP